MSKHQMLHNTHLPGYGWVHLMEKICLVNIVNGQILGHNNKSFYQNLDTKYPTALEEMC